MLVFYAMHKRAQLKDNSAHFLYQLSITPVIIPNLQQKYIFSFLSHEQKCLTSRFDSAIISLNLLYGKCVGAERVVGTMTAESCRVVRGNSRESDEVHSVSSVLKASRHNGGDRYIAEAFQALWFTICAAKSIRYVL